MTNKIAIAGPPPGGKVRLFESDNGDTYVYAVDPVSGLNVGQAILAFVDAGLGDGRFKVVRYGNGADPICVLATDGKTHIVGLTTPA